MALEIKVKVVMHRNYGRTDVSYEVESNLVPVEGSIVTADLLTAVLLRYFTHFEEQTLVQIKGAKPHKHIEEQTVTATSLAVNMKAGKKLYNVMCGVWMKHGVPFYEEHMKAAGINPKEIPDDGLQFNDGTKVIVELEDGVVKRVVGFANRP